MIIHFNKQTPEYIREFAYFAARELGMDRLRGECEIRYVYGELEENSFGLCWGDGRETEIHIASRQYGRTISREDKLKTVAHEMTHARQYLKRELISNKDDVNDNNVAVAKWCGHPTLFNLADETDTPWEVEARLMEEKIYMKWLSLTV